MQYFKRIQLKGSTSLHVATGVFAKTCRASLCEQKFFTVVLVLALSLSACTTTTKTKTLDNAVEPTVSNPVPPGSAIASAHPLATAAGLAVLEEGGNAFDAAVTFGMALSVVEPFGSGIGGGGFWLLQPAGNKPVFIDGREQAPASAYKTMFQVNGEVDRELATNHPLAAGIPGTVAALMHVHQKYGVLSRQRVMAPAIELAEQGFEIGIGYQSATAMRKKQLLAGSTESVFLDNGAVPAVGWVLRQPAMAQTLRAIALRGRDGFYKGVVAAKLVTAVQGADGLWTRDDLADYEVVEREPVTFGFNGARVTTSPLPSSGGLVLGMLLGQLERWYYFDAPPELRNHLLIESMRNAYEQRALHMGDPDYTKDSGYWMLANEFIDDLAAKISEEQAGSSVYTPTAQTPEKPEGRQTTHYSILDRHGNRVAATVSLNYYFGSGFVAEGTGVVLNNEMDDFVAKAGEANGYELVGGEANSIEPGKRPLSSMTPTFVETNQKLLILGTPGGSRIISMVAGGILELFEAEPEQVAKAVVARKRFHHQFLPDRVDYESGALSEKDAAYLRKLGHELKPVGREYGDMQAVFWNKRENTLTASADPRGEGEGSVTYRQIDSSDQPSAPVKTCNLRTQFRLRCD